MKMKIFHELSCNSSSLNFNHEARFWVRLDAKIRIWRSPCQFFSGIKTLVFFFHKKEFLAFSFTDMSEVNLEKLVAEYINDELQPTCHNTPIIYEIYEQLLDILIIKGTNVQHAMTMLIPQIHQDAIPPVHAQQLTCKVWTHLSRNKPKEELISMLYPKKDDAQKISDYCS